MSADLLELPPIEATREQLALGARRHSTQASWGPVVWHEWGRGPVLVLLHGGTGSWMHWVRNIAPLARHARLLVPDLPGMGESAVPPRFERVEDLVEAMARAIDEGLEVLAPAAPVHIAGFSFGAMVGAFVAAWRGQRVASFTMVGGSGLGLAFAGPGALRKPSPDLDEHGWRELHRANLAAVMLGSMGAVDEAALEMQILNAAGMRVRSHTAAVTEVMREPLARIRAPKRAYWGEHDPFFPSDQGALADLMRAHDITWERLPGAAHWGQYQASEQFNRDMVGVLLAR